MLFRFYQFESVYRHFLQSSQLYLSQIGTLYTHFKAFRGAFYFYRNNFFPKISYLATGPFTSQVLLPTQLATIVQELAAEEFRKGSKLTCAIPSGLEAIYYELHIVLEVTMLLKGIFLSLASRWIPIPRPKTFSRPNLCINPTTTARRRQSTKIQNSMSRLQQTISILQS